MKEIKIKYEETQYGFIYGGANIQRITSDDKKGWVALELKTSKSRVAIYVTKTGKVTIYVPETVKVVKDN
jgi:hypothetical protein